MKLNDFKNILSGLNHPAFALPSGEHVPPHYHLTEVGEITKNFVDCGGTVRHEKVVSFQLWTADDFDHRLEAQTVISIIEMAESELGIGNLDVEVEYQSDTIGKYGLEFDGQVFQLTSTQTDCLAKEKCGIPTAAPIALKVSEGSSPCSPESGCC